MGYVLILHEEHKQGQPWRVSGCLHQMAAGSCSAISLWGHASAPVSEGFWGSTQESSSMLSCAWGRGRYPQGLWL